MPLKIVAVVENDLIKEEIRIIKLLATQSNITKANEFFSWLAMSDKKLLKKALSDMAKICGERIVKDKKEYIKPEKDLFVFDQDSGMLTWFNKKSISKAYFNDIKKRTINDVLAIVKTPLLPKPPKTLDKFAVRDQLKKLYEQADLESRKALANCARELGFEIT